MNLKDCLLKETPFLRPETINLLAKFIELHQLNWFPGKQGRGVWFTVMELQKISNLHIRSLKRACLHFLHNTEIKFAPVAPIFLPLASEEIIELRSKQPHLGIPTNTAHLNICNWTLVYAQFINPIFPPMAPPVASELKLAEAVVQRQFVELGSYTSNPFRQEVLVKDTVSGLANSRRYDLVREQNKVIEVYELKARALTAHDVTTTLAEKAYLELAQSHFSQRIQFCFVAESITVSAARALRMLNVPVGFKTIKQFAQELRTEIRQQVADHDTWFYERELSDRISILN